MDWEQYLDDGLALLMAMVAMVYLFPVPNLAALDDGLAPLDYGLALLMALVALVKPNLAPNLAPKKLNLMFLLE